MGNLELKNRCAIYCRLSREDGNEESQSISSQKEILTDYAQKQNWNIVGIYTDDGYSGTNFDRPDFQKLLKDIELGKIDIVITKDLSRLGRNYIQTGYYTEEYFPNHNIRYIALNDGFDTNVEEGNDFVPFKNIINEWYAKDISKKIRFTLDNKAKNGEPRRTVFPIFGYAYNDAYERVPDPETAPIVQLIFRKYIEWSSTYRIANYLKEQKIKIPSYYNAVKYNYNKKKVLEKSEDELTTWGKDVVRDILMREEYLGVYKTAQSKSKSFKNKKRTANKDCYVFPNRYEPLIDRETWEIANKMLKRTRSGLVSRDENIFKGLVFCQDCGHLMRFERRLDKKTNQYSYRYYCLNKLCGNGNCISRENLHKVVKYEVLALKQSILSKPNEFIELSRKYDKKGRIIKTDTEAEILKATKKNDEIDMFIQKLFEQNAKGIIPTSTFDMMMGKYNKEKEMVEDEIRSLTRKHQEELSLPKNENSANELISELENLSEEDILSYKVLQKLIKRITVKSTSVNNNTHKRIFEITIVFSYCDEVIKEFRTYEK